MTCKKNTGWHHCCKSSHLHYRCTVKPYSSHQLMLGDTRPNVHSTIWSTRRAWMIGKKIQFMKSKENWKHRRKRRIVLLISFHSFYLLIWIQNTRGEWIVQFELRAVSRSSCHTMSSHQSITHAALWSTDLLIHHAAGLLVLHNCFLWSQFSSSLALQTSAYFLYRNRCCWH